MVTWINNAAPAVFGNRVGQPFVCVVAPEYVDLVGRQLDRKLSGEPVTDYEVEVFTLPHPADAIEQVHVPPLG